MKPLGAERQVARLALLALVVVSAAGVLVIARQLQATLPLPPPSLVLKKQ